MLPQDWKYTALGLSPEESQFLQTRQHGRTDIAALFRVPPSMVGDTSRLSNANHEQLSLQLITDTLRPYLVRIEKEIQRKLLNDASLFVEFDVSERLRGDFVSTMNGFGVGKQWGFYSTNEVREKLGENPIGPAGDVYWAPVNMTNAANLIAPAPDPSPLPLLDPPTESQRSLFRDYIPTFSGLFTDAVGRVATRTKRDVETITPILSPVLDSILKLCAQEARHAFNLPDTWNPSERVCRDHLKSVVTRCGAWTEQTKQEAASTELAKAIRSLRIGVFSEAGITVGQTRLTNE